MNRVSAKTKKAQMGYERHPPTCSSCAHYEKNALKLPPGTPYQPGRCNYGGFTTFYTAVCDVWQGRDGATLDDKPLNLGDLVRETHQ